MGLTNNVLIIWICRNVVIQNMENLCSPHHAGNENRSIIKSKQQQQMNVHQKEIKAHAQDRNLVQKVTISYG